MSLLTQEDLQLLTAQREGPCISVFMPTFKKGQEVRQNPIRFKNMLDQVADKLRENGMNNPHIQETLAPARTLLDDGSFWQTQENGLAVFFAPGVFQTYRLPHQVDEMVVVNDRFHIKPVLPLLHGGKEFFILTLQKDKVNLYKASESSIEEVEVPGMPRQLEETKPDKSEGEMTIHQPPTYRQSSVGQGQGKQAGFHGHGQADDNQDKDIVRFYRMISEPIFDFIKETRAPLVLAGMEYLVPLYRDVNRYPNLVEQWVEGSPENARTDELREQAWQLVKPRFESLQSDSVDQYKQLAGWKDQRAVKDIKEVIKAAPYGRIDVLFVDKNAKVWGTFDETNVDVKIEKDPGPGTQDLLDFAAVQTIMNGGTVFVVDPEEIPEGSGPVAAILRY